MNYEGAILNAIGEAKIRNLNIIKIGLPVRIQKEIVLGMLKPTENEIKIDVPPLKGIYGIPVEEAETFQITTEFSSVYVKDEL